MSLKKFPALSTAPIYVFDLDGTLADMQHRVKYIQKDYLRRAPNDDDWRNFYRACPLDTPIKSTIFTLNRLRQTGADIRVWTGREASVRIETEKWLSAYTGLSLVHIQTEGVLKMRSIGNRAPDHVIKKAWLDSLTENERNCLVAVFEDRDQVVKMWRSQGVTCYQVAEGGF